MSPAIRTAEGSPVSPSVPDYDLPSTWKPTKKLVAAAVMGVAAIVAQGVLTGFDTTERGEAVTLALALVTAYFRGNDPTPGGVPVDKS